jgi:hypothetical protein
MQIFSIRKYWILNNYRDYLYLHFNNEFGTMFYTLMILFANKF